MEPGEYTREGLHFILGHSKGIHKGTISQEVRAMSFIIPQRKKGNPRRDSTALHLSPGRIATINSDRIKDNQAAYATAITRKQTIAEAIGEARTCLLRIAWGKAINPQQEAKEAIDKWNKAEGK